MTDYLQKNLPNILPNNKLLKLFLLRLRMRYGCLLSSLSLVLLDIALVALSVDKKDKKKKREIQVANIGMEEIKL